MSHTSEPTYDPRDYPDPLRNESPPAFAPFVREPGPLTMIDLFRRHLLYVDPEATVDDYLRAIPGARTIHVTPSNEMSYNYLVTIAPPLSIRIIRPDTWLRTPDF